MLTKATSERDIINVASEGWQWPPEEPPHSDKLSVPRVDEAEKQRWCELAAEEWRKAHAPSVEEVFAVEALSLEENRAIEAFRQKARAAEEFEAKKRGYSELVEHLLFVMNDEDDPKLSAIDNQRRKYGRMLWAIAKICYDSGQLELGLYIAGLGVRLEDLIKGVTDPLFVVTKGLKRDSMLVWSVRQGAALGIECFILSGLTRDEAANIAAQKYRGLARLMRGERRDLAGSLLSWYDRYVEGGERVPVPKLVASFHEMRRQLKADKLAPPEYRRLGEQAFAKADKSALAIR